MVVGVLQLEVSVFDAMTLKDKRQVIKSFKDRVRHKFNVSIAEVDRQDLIRSAVLGVVVVSNEGPFVESVLSSIVDLARATPQLTLVDYLIEKV